MDYQQRVNDWKYIATLYTVPNRVPSSQEREEPQTLGQEALVSTHLFTSLGLNSHLREVGSPAFFSWWLSLNRPAMLTGFCIEHGGGGLPRFIPGTTEQTCSLTLGTSCWKQHSSKNPV